MRLRGPVHLRAILCLGIASAPVPLDEEIRLVLARDSNFPVLEYEAPARCRLRFSALHPETGINIVSVMSFIGSGVEYALHCLLWIAPPLDHRPSSRDLAELQGVSPAFLAKIFAKLEKANIVEATEGIRGGYALARPTDEISVLDVVDAVEGRKSLFNCQEIRSRCALFNGNPPSWAVSGVCGIHAVMLRAEREMREELARTKLSELAAGFRTRRLPADFPGQVREWFADRQAMREGARVAAIRRKTRRGKAKPSSSI